MNARMDAAVTVDAQNAPTATWKTAQHAVSHSAHTHHRLTHEIPDTSRHALVLSMNRPKAGVTGVRWARAVTFRTSPCLCTSL